MDTLGTLDWVVVAAYLGVVGALGYACSSTASSAKDYFLGGRQLPWWAATLSIIATETSAVSFIGLPAAAYGGNWSVLQLVAGLILGRLFLAFVFVRVFYERDDLTVYGFLSHRFGERTRRLAALLFVVGRLVASGVRLYGGCFAIHIASGLPIEWSIVILAAVGTALAYSGGIKTVVWTDVLLGLTLIAGGLVVGLCLLSEIPGGLQAVMNHETFAAKTSIVGEFFGGLGNAKSLVAGLLGGFVLTMATHGTDQDIAQRILTCRDSKTGSLSLIGSAALILPVFALFLAVGTLLHFEQVLGHPGAERPPADNKLLPGYIANSLPAGLGGFVMAGLLAAALSSFTSALNALASTAVGDFLVPLRPSIAKRDVFASKVATLVLAVVLAGVALGFVGSGKNIFTLSIQVFSYVYGALLGAFLLGILTKRGNDVSAPIGMLISVPLALTLQLREFVKDPGKAPNFVRSAIDSLPESVQSVLVESIPDVAPLYWLIVSTAACGIVAAVGRRKA
ncbi:MAG: sodium/solute symporter [Planctomycetota bacterium]